MERSIDIDRDTENGEIKNAISTLLEPYSFGIVYSPLRTEVAPASVVSLSTDVEIYVIAPRASLDPVAEAANVLELAKERPAFILIPGRQFDATSTRHGQGGGWYDRFLSYIPASWLRVGFCFSDQFFDAPLLRQPWDQLMDFVCVVERLQKVDKSRKVDTSSTQTVTLHKTNGRAHDIPTIIA